MKKLLVVIMLVFAVLPAKGADITWSDGSSAYYFNKVDYDEVENAVEYVEYNNNSSSGYIEIPSTFEDEDDRTTYTVIGIGDGACQGTQVYSVKVPETVRYIGKYAFNGSYLSTITFEGDSQLETIESYAFAACTSLMEFKTPSSVSSIGSMAFGSSAITSITIPASVTEIETQTFMNCTSLTEVVFEGEITQIGLGAFQYAPLESVTIYATNPPELGENAFTTAPEDATLLVPLGSYTAYKSSEWVEYFDIQGYDALQDGIYYVISNDNEAQIVAIDEDTFNEKFTLYSVIEINGEEYKITSIAEGVFYDYNDLEITIENEDPDDITIGISAFSSNAGVLNVPTGCVTLYKSSHWADSLDIQGDYIMYNGVGYSYVYVDSELKALSDREIALEVSYIQEDVTEVIIPRTINLGDDVEVTVVSISQDVDFKNLQNLTQITLEADIPVEDATALEKVPEGITVVVPADRVDEYEQMFKSANIEVNVVSLENSSIKKITTNRTILAIYNLAGQRLTTPTKGINIFYYSDGTTRKILLK